MKRGLLSRKQTFRIFLICIIIPFAFFHSSTLVNGLPERIGRSSFNAPNCFVFEGGQWRSTTQEEACKWCFYELGPIDGDGSVNDLLARACQSGGNSDGDTLPDSGDNCPFGSPDSEIVG